MPKILPAKYKTSKKIQGSTKKYPHRFKKVWNPKTTEGKNKKPREVA
ncbi:MAG: hypothetical protein N3G78_14360 [Desulfobacterota bacterium]|nr:hypothetical protein [Thermodesulfobacteriota bacterium]